MYSNIVFERKDAIAAVTLTRPRVLNALSRARSRRSCRTPSGAPGRTRRSGRSSSRARATRRSAPDRI